MESARTLVDRCFHLFENGALDEAIELAGEGVQAYPDEGELWQLRGLLMHRARNHDAASQALETASLLIPLNAYAQCALAECHARAGKSSLAHALYQRLAENTTCPTALLPAVAAGLGGCGDYWNAFEVCQELAKREPTCHDAFFGMACYQRRMGAAADSVLPALTRAHELAPDISVYRVSLASLLAESGCVDRACALLRPLRPESIRCGRCIRRILAILEHAADTETLERFRRHLSTRTSESEEPAA